MMGQIKKLGNRYYIYLNNEGTLERLKVRPSGFRILLWHFRNAFRKFKSVNETKRFLGID